jgi:hypothetical protein
MNEESPSHKRRSAGLLIVLAPLLLCTCCSTVSVIPRATGANEGKALLETHWRGDGPYARFAPGPETTTLGCWSTAFAQIFYHHRLQPFGRVDYSCTKGYEIEEDLSRHTYDWDQFTTAIEETTPQTSANEIARYCYSVATVVQKDFGTGQYMKKFPRKNIESHFRVDADQVLVYRGLFHSKRSVRNMIIREIESNRPVYLHYRNMKVKGSGHSVVIDGYRADNGNFVVHINFGWGGRADGWYDLFDPIRTEGDTQLRIFITIWPLR